MYDKEKIMNESKLKNIVVLRNLSSNIIDEAIVFVKPNIKIPIASNMRNMSSSLQTSSDNFIINEAKFLIENYTKEIEGKKKDQEKILKKKNRLLKRVNIALLILTALLIMF